MKPFFVRALRASGTMLGAAAIGAPLLLFSVSEARADDMDLALSRLRIAAGEEGCARDLGNGTVRDFCADDDKWRSLMSQFAASLAPPMTSPARTLGYGGFYVGLEGSVTPIDSGQDYWREGTEGDEDAGAEGRNRFPDSTLVWARVAVRKGLPFGFELGTSFSYLVNTELYSWGLEVKWSLLEGFREGVGGLFPDVAVRGAVQTLTGDSEFNLTIPSVDVIISKPITIAGTGTLTPFISGQIYWVFADSELVDTTPEVSAFDECQPDPTALNMSDGSTVRCTRDTATDPLPNGRTPGQDYNNNDIFAQIRAPRTRAAIGVTGRYELFTLTASFQFDLVKPHDMDSDMPSGLPRQWTLAAGAGLTF